MCRGRLAISGSVVYSSRTKPVKALPPRRSRRKPRMPDVASITPARVTSTRAVACSGPPGAKLHVPRVA